jgi:deaminated glutathione amidase
MNTIAPYKALALQTNCYAINAIENNFLQHRLKIIERVGKQIKASKQFIGQDVKLVVLPEYFTTGFPMGETIEQWQTKGCIANGSEEYKAMADIAIENNIFVSGNWYELDEHFTSIYFQTSFIINPKGETILRYRRLNSMYAPTPHDVLDEYLKHYGADSLFPVADTEIGKLACIASEEILYPEIARCLAINGAEIFLHSSSEVASPIPTQKNIAKQARAIENMAYVVSSNSALIADMVIPEASTNGHSQIVNFEGLKLCEAYTGESMVANSYIDLHALRHHRQRPGMSNFLSRQRFELFAPTYNKSIYPANNMDVNNVNRMHFVNTQKEVIASLHK